MAGNLFGSEFLIIREFIYLQLSNRENDFLVAFPCFPGKSHSIGDIGVQSGDDIHVAPEHQKDVFSSPVVKIPHAEKLVFPALNF